MSWERLYCNENAAQLGTSNQICVIGRNEFGFPAAEDKGPECKKATKKVGVARGSA